MKLLVLCSFFLIGVVFCEVNRLECIESYFAKTIDNSTEDGKICEQIIQNHTDKFKVSKEQILNDGRIYEKTCALNLQEDYKLSDFCLKGMAQHLRNEIDETHFERNCKMIFEISESYRSEFCESEEKLKRLVERLITDAKEKSEDHDSLCLKKHLIDTQIIDPTEFNFDATTINVTDCQEIIDK
jgi:hypothetical protein